MTSTTLLGSLMAFGAAFLASRVALASFVLAGGGRVGQRTNFMSDARHRASSWISSTRLSATLLPRVQSNLARAGRDREIAADWAGAAIVQAAGIGLVVAILTLFGLARSSSVIVALLVAAIVGGLFSGAAFAYLLNGLHSEAELRARRVVRLLPYSIELIILVAEAGGSLEEGLSAIINTMPAEPLAQELSRVLGERDMGRPLAEAFKSMADRLQAKEVIQLVTTIEIGRELGTRTAASLSGFAEWLRTKRVLDGEKMAREAAPKMALPNTLIMVANVLLILAPFVPALSVGGL